jgi:hypothetical protein
MFTYDASPLKPIKGSTEKVNKIKFQIKKNVENSNQTCYFYKLEIAFSSWEQ